MNKVLVCPIAYNENVKLKSVIERFLKSGFQSQADYLVVDDGSTDGTTEIIKSYASRGVKTIKHGVKSGVGKAIRSAIKYALDHQYEVLVIMAGNDKDNPEEIHRLINPILNDGCDFVQGSRYLPAAGQQGWQAGLTDRGTGGDMPAYRKVATRLHPLLMSWITGHKVTDSTNGFRAFRLTFLKHPDIDIDQSWLNAYELEPYLLYKAIKLKYRFIEAPVTKIYPSRKLGYTKMKPLLGWWSILKPLVYLGLGIKK